MRSRSITLRFAGLAVVAAGIFFFQTRPSDTVSAIQEAAISKDYETLEEFVDFFTLRTSLKQTLETNISNRLELQSHNLNSELGTIFGNTNISTIVERAVSPKGLNLVLTGADLETISAPGFYPDASLERFFSDKANHETEWNSLSEYSITVRRDGQRTARLFLQRDGIFHWKLVGIELL
ncbi:MAG TPA: DUF2939 domain-containing protein [Noviherbaspirillum sp.]|nr:DUF2939 domain-containing protein [Noviherbaspirillum sp.]